MESIAVQNAIELALKDQSLKAKFNKNFQNLLQSLKRHFSRKQKDMGMLGIKADNLYWQESKIYEELDDDISQAINEALDMLELEESKALKESQQKYKKNKETGSLENFAQSLKDFLNKFLQLFKKSIDKKIAEYNKKLGTLEFGKDSAKIKDMVAKIKQLKELKLDEEYKLQESTQIYKKESEDKDQVLNNQNSERSTSNNAKQFENALPFDLKSDLKEVQIKRGLNQKESIYDKSADSLAGKRTNSNESTKGEGFVIKRQKLQEATKEKISPDETPSNQQTNKGREL